MNYKTLVSRYERGWEVSRILLTPVANPEEFRKAAGMRKRSRAETGLAHLILSQFLETYGPGPFMFMNCPKVFHVEGFENYHELQRLTNGAFDNQIAVAFQEDIHRRFPGVPSPRAVMRVMRATVPVELKYVYSLPAPADWQQIKCGISLEWGMTSLEVAREISARRIRDEEVLISRTWENKPREIHREHARKNGSISWEEWDEIVRFYMGRYGVDWWDKKRSLHLPVTIQLDRIWGDPLPPIDDPRLKVPMAQAYIARDPELRAIYGEILSEECLSRLAADG